MRSLVPVISLAVVSFTATGLPQTPRTIAPGAAFPSPTAQCFTLKVYAPKGKRTLHAQGGIEKPYVPQPFVLQSTCSKAAGMVLLPSSRRSKPEAKLVK